MKKHIILTAALAAFCSASAFAGQSYTKEIVAPEPIYGTGFYGALQAGINAYQDLDEASTTIGGSTLVLDPNEKIGFVGGLKLGYVFGTAMVRPAIEADLYYNGFETDYDATINGDPADINAEGDLHSGAFMGNFLLRFAFNRFQPYLGGGVGGYYAELQDSAVEINGRRFESPDSDDSGFAWQLIGGADYYFTEKVSAFAEYKFLNYEDSSLDDDRLSQHIAVLGLRWHF